MKRLLLHICCGPCAIYPFSDLVKAGFEVEGFFYNPNIQPDSEHLKREKATKDFEKIFNAKVHFSSYQKREYLDCIRETKDKTSRCRSCFKLRLKATHQFALENKFDFFTTTLLVSPYQDQKVIEQIGDNVSKGSKTQFLFRDFRPGFRQAHVKAKELNLYCQKYCGCLSSLEERNRLKEEKGARC
ncbi:MAG: epoxyqueuosine reductase QueH [Candidatus Omnitrophota bacterium]